MLSVGLTPAFEKSLGKLTKQEQALVKQVPTDFMLNPEKPGHRLHKLNTKEARFASISVSMDLRIIVLRDGGRMLFCYVAHHDDAYRWAERRRLEVHPMTGAAQLVELEEVVREEIRLVPREVASPPLFAGEADGYLLSLGVPEAWLAAVKDVDEDGLMEIVGRLPEEAAESLVALAAGERPEARAAAAGVAAADPFEHPDARRRFWVATDEAALRQALDYPWARWMVFLHPSQRDAVERNFGGPARVTGGAGTGKTVVALHRAAHLARLSGHARILLTTFSRTLAGRLSAGLDQLLGSDAPERGRITVEHLHKTAFDIVSGSAATPPVPVKPEALEALLQEAAEAEGLGDVPPEFLRAEWDAVIDYWGVADWNGYRDIRRSGRGTALSPARRRRLWPVFARVQAEMRDRGLMTWSDMAERAREILEAGRTRPYRYVIVDEAQDFGPREIRFVMALAPLGARSHLFAGDTGQRIYRYPFSWLGAGVDIRGRAARLYVNYRTTGEIKRYADSVLPAVMTGPDETEEDRSAVSLLSGPPPDVAGCGDAGEERAALAAWLRELSASGVAPAEIAVFARTRRALRERAVPAAEAADLPYEFLTGDQPPSDAAVSLGTLHIAKGLEYRAVALVGCERELLPHPGAVAASDSEEARAIAEARERQLFYVGCTRARDLLRISYAGDPSPFLADA